LLWGSALKLHLIFRLWLHGVNYFAYLLKQEAHFLEVAVTWLNKLDALENKVGLLFLLFRMQLLKHFLDFYLAVLNDLVLREVKLADLEEGLNDDIDVLVNYTLEMDRFLDHRGD